MGSCDQTVELFKTNSKAENDAICLSFKWPPLSRKNLVVIRSESHEMSNDPCVGFSVSLFRWRIQFNPASPLRFLCSLDHPIRSCQHIRRNRQADLLRSLEIDHQLELLWLLYG
jgi:hypothetical protein